MDPLTQAIAAVIEGILQRGISIQPREAGWIIKIADVEDSGPPSAATPERSAFEGRLSRSW